MAESDIQVGSTVRYVGFKRDVRDGADGVVVGSVPQCDLLVVDFGGAIGKRLQSPSELELVLPPKPPTEAPTLNDYDIATDPELIESLSERVFNVLASSPKAPSIEAPPLNAFDLVEGPDGVIWTVGRQSDDAVELHHQLAGCCYERQRVARKWPRKRRLGTSPRAQEVRQYIASLPSTSSLVAVSLDEVPFTDAGKGPDGFRFVTTRRPIRKDGEEIAWNAIREHVRCRCIALPLSGPRLEERLRCAAESGSGIAASPVSWKRQPTACSALGKPLPRPRRRHQTTSWDPDMPLDDAEPGRYGWLP